MPWIPEKVDVFTVVQRRWVKLVLFVAKDTRLFYGQAEQGEGLMEQEAPPAAEGAGDQGDQQGPQVMEDS